jgi:hypothetical protein
MMVMVMVMRLIRVASSLKLSVTTKLGKTNEH